MISYRAETSTLTTVLVGSAIIIAISLTRLFSFLLFHTLAEMLSITVASGIFMLTWNARRQLNNNFLLIVGVSSLFVAILDLLHTLAYQGIGIFPTGSANLPTQLWLAARYLQSASLLTGVLLTGRRFKPNYIFLTYLGITTLLLLSIFEWSIFPASFVEGSGLTPFKRGSEIVITLMLLASAAFMHRRGVQLDPPLQRLLLIAILLMAYTELIFVVYATVQDWAVFTGHVVKGISTLLLYRVLVVTSFQQPRSLLFHELKQAESRYRKLFDEAPAMYVVTRQRGPSSVIEDTNMLFLNTLGYQREDVTGRPLADFYVKASHPEPQRRPGTQEREAQLQTSDGNLVHVLERRVEAFDGSPDNFQIMFVDITARKKAEAEREQLIAELESYNHTVAHDLKSPLSVVQGFADLLSTEHVHMADEKLTEHLETIGTYTRKMRDIVDSLLLLSSVRANNVDVEPLGMQQIVQQAIDSLATVIEEKDATVILSEAWPEAVGYAPWIEAVWRNYLSNALKYGGSPPVIELGAADEGTHAYYWVRDNGQGVTLEEQARLFEPFTQLARNRKDGHGLGLSIVARIVNRLGGEVRVESQPGRGWAAGSGSHYRGPTRCHHTCPTCSSSTRTRKSHRFSGDSSIRAVHRFCLYCFCASCVHRMLLIFDTSAPLEIGFAM